MIRALQRLTNGLRKVAAGLRPFNESVWPGVRNDLFVAHESIYAWVAALARGARVLDAGCGTGYGSALLAEGGARRVVGVDIDRRTIRYARRRHPSIEFRVGDIERLDLPPDSFDLVVASNAAEHLHDPARFVRGMREVLSADGTLIVAVPPIYTSHDRDVHGAIHYHRSNLTIDEWVAAFERGGFAVQCVAHRARPGVAPDFASPFPSELTRGDFEFAETDRDGLYAEPCITAIFRLR